VYEWRVQPAAWLQLVAGDPSAPGAREILRLGVGDIEDARTHLAAAGARVGEVTGIPGVIASTTPSIRSATRCRSTRT
jgi:hypothetical protein